jgi:hypothetical protein
MNKQFPGQKEKAIAAYNCGPGGVRRAEELAHQKGGDWRQYLPQETQKYLTKVSQIEGQHGNIQHRNTNVGGVAAEVPLAAGETNNVKPQLLSTKDQQGMDKFHAAQQDPSTMAAIAYDPRSPDWLRQVASKQLHSQLTDQKAKQDAKNEIEASIASGNTSDFAKHLNDKSESGSYVKAYLFHRFGLDDLAKNEQQKLGAGNQWRPAVGPQGERATINYDGNNQAQEGYDVAGRKLTGDELAKYSANSYDTTKATTAADVYYDPMAPSGARFAKVDTPNGAYFQEANTQRRATPAEQAKLVKMSAAGPLEQQQAAAIAKAAGATQGAALASGNMPNAVNVNQAQQMNQPQGQVPQGGAVAPGSIPAPVAQGGAPVAPPALPQQAAPVQGATPQVAAPLWQQQQQHVLSGEEQKAFVKNKEEMASNADQSQQISITRAQQVNKLISNPQMMGYLAANPTENGAYMKLMRDVITGKYEGEHGGDLSDAIRTAGLPPALVADIQEYAQQNTKINSLTLHSNEGAGKISNFEIKNNQNNNMQNIGELGPWAVLTGLTRTQFVADTAVAKQQFAQQHPELNTASGFQSAWAPQVATIQKQYDAVYAARLQAVKPYYDKAMLPANGNNEEVQNAYRKAAVASFKSYPNPTFDATTNKWTYGTKQSKLAVMAATIGE